MCPVAARAAGEGFANAQPILRAFPLAPVVGVGAPTTVET